MKYECDNATMALHFAYASMSFTESTPTPTGAKCERESASDYSVFDSFCFRGTVMARKQRFKRVAQPKLLVPQQIEPAHKTTRRSKSAKLSAKPNPSSESEPHISSGTKSETLPRDFFQIDALDLAPRLLGKFLRRDDVVLQITEVRSFGHIAPHVVFCASVGLYIG